MNPDLAKTLADVISFILQIVNILVFASIIVSWIGDRNNQIVAMIHSITEPMYRPLRPFTNKLPGPIDWAPLAVFLLVIIINGLVVGPLERAAGLVR